jgi:hypothetical protein
MSLNKCGNKLFWLTERTSEARHLLIEVPPHIDESNLEGEVSMIMDANDIDFENDDWDEEVEEWDALSYGSGNEKEEPEPDVSILTPEQLEGYGLPAAPEEVTP